MASGMKMNRGASMRLLLVMLLATVIAAAPSVGHATSGDDVQKSRALYKKGEMAFATGDYEQAATLFQQAYEISQRPQLLWNLAAAHKRWFETDPSPAHLRKARAIYENYASLIGTPKEVAEAKQEIALLDTQLAAVDKTPAPAAPAATTTAAVKETQRPDLTLPVTSAPVDKTPAAETRPAAAVAAPVTAPVETPASASTPVYKKWWLWTIVGVVVVGAGVGTGVALGMPHDAASPTGLNAGTYTPTFP